MMTATRQTARLTRKPAASFGAGIVRFVPHYPDMPFTQADLDWAAAEFARDDEPDYDMLAGEAAFVASCEALSPPPAGSCRSCGQPIDSPSDIYCDACDDAGTEATIKGQNGRAGLGYRVN